MTSLAKQRPDLVVATERLTLRPLRLDDAARIHALFANWDVVHYLSAPPWPYSIDDAHAFVADCVNPTSEDAESVFAICLDGDLIGCIGVRIHEAGNLQRGPGPHIGYWLGQPYWGMGYMTEAARGFIARVFEAYRADTVYSGAFAENTASLRVQEKIGFARDGLSTLFSRPRGGDFPSVNTVLTRRRFEEARP